MCIYSSFFFLVFLLLFLFYASATVELNKHTHTLARTYKKKLFKPFIHCTPGVFAHAFIMHEYAVIVFGKPRKKKKLNEQRVQRKKWARKGRGREQTQKKNE